MMKKIPEPRPFGKMDNAEDDAFSVVSSTECTGLIPTPPADNAQADSYSEIVGVPHDGQALAGHAHEIKRSRQDIASDNRLDDTEAAESS